MGKGKGKLRRDTFMQGKYEDIKRGRINGYLQQNRMNQGGWMLQELNYK